MQLKELEARQEAPPEEMTEGEAEIPLDRELEAITRERD